MVHTHTFSCRFGSEVGIPVQDAQREPVIQNTLNSERSVGSRELCKVMTWVSRWYAPKTKRR